jgi:hypothetical protein
LALLESSNSVEQHVYLQKGESPEKIQQYYLKEDGVVRGGKQSQVQQRIIKPVESTYKFEEKKRPNILRTIYMPNYEVDEAKKQIEELRREIEEERAYYTDVVKGLHDEKSVFEED